jgi:broad specificity phosphatase PhoE
MGVVLLVRHGQASWGAADYDVLSNLGEEQARLVGAALAGFEADVVMHGAMVRQRRTAELAAAAAGWSCALREDPDWDEMDHEAVLSALPAPFEGREPTPTEFQAWFEAATERWLSGENDADYHESFAAFTHRVSAALARLVDRVGRGGKAVVFTSGGPISWLASDLLDAGLPTYTRLAPVVVNASITRLVTGHRGTTLVSFNEHPHLEADRLTYR